MVDGEEEYEVERILDSWQFGRRRKLQYLVKWKGYPDSENQWVDKDDIFADKALQEFKSLNPAAEVHIRHLHIPENCIITLTDKYMTSPTPSTIDNAVLPLHDAQDYPLSRIFGQLIECYDPGSDFSARLLTGHDYGTPKVSFHISHGQSSQSA